ncbi:MAG: TraR/DksA family transcriptional regulator [Hydrogenophilaceae bacterium]|nr:TraR/DksA family transcriptional regulator [Hydrogenophilaceae bacterium]
MSKLNNKDRQAILAALQSRKTALLAEVRAALAAGDDNQYREILGNAPGDSSDEALASSLADLAAARMDREVREYRALEAAEQRLDTAEFGLCQDCGAAIPVGRLLANPAATRCVQCQEIFDRTHAGQAHGSL